MKIRYADDRFPIFDNYRGIDGPADRYTIVDTGGWESPYYPGTYHFNYAGFDDNPFNPSGIGMHAETAYKFWKAKDWLGENKRISFRDLPPKAQLFVQQFMDSADSGWHGGDPALED